MKEPVGGPLGPNSLVLTAAVALSAPQHPRVQSYKCHRLRKGRFSETGRIYLVTTRCVPHRPIFANSSAAQIVMNEIHRRSEEGSCENLTCVVMPDHIHWLLRITATGDLSQVVGRMKGRSAHRINHQQCLTGKVWQSGFYDHAVRREEDLENLANYVVYNPIRAGLVSSVNDHPYWWSIWHDRGVFRA